MNYKSRKFIYRTISIFTMLVLLLSFVLVIPFRSQAARKYVICIDPGHGGKSTGAVFFGINEKDIDLVVAEALRDKLSEFNNVEVVLTRNGDIDLSYEERVKVAADSKADFLVSVHFNGTENHMSTGSEIYVSKDANLYRQVMPSAIAIKEQLEELCVHSNGIFSRTGEEGQDYYGMIRHCSLYKIPSMIVEHCCMDREEYRYLFSDEESLKLIGERDAIAIARALKLKSDEYDFTKEPDIKYDPPALLDKDFSTPDKAEISLESFIQTSPTSCVATICVRANDPKGTLKGFKVSEDCGKTYTKEYEFEYGGVGHFNVLLDTSNPKTISALVYNEEQRCLTSNFLDPLLEIELDPDFFSGNKPGIEDASGEAVSEEDVKVVNVFDHDPKFDALKSIVVVFGAMMGCVLCVLLFLMARKESGAENEVKNNNEEKTEEKAEIKEDET